jgi:hypothetical protein
MIGGAAMAALIERLKRRRLRSPSRKNGARDNP